MRPRLLGVLGLSSLLSSAALALNAGQEAKAKTLGGGAITISPETTYLLGPVTNDGVIDYGAALNELYGRGVTHEDNAAIPFLQALGAKLLPEPWADAQKKLGLDRLPEPEGCYLGVAPRGDQPIGGFVAKVIKDRPQVDGQALQAQLRSELLEVARKGLWSAEEFPRVREWLERNEKPLDLIVEGSRRRRYWIPLPEGAKAPVPSVEAWREVPEALRARAALRLASGNASGAIADLAAVHRLADRVAQGPWLVDSLIGVAIRGTGARMLPVAAANLSAADARRMLAELNGLDRFPDTVERFDRGERFVRLAEAIHLQRIGAARGLAAWKEYYAPETRIFPIPQEILRIPPDAVDWNEVLRLLNREQDLQVALARAPSAAERQSAQTTIGGEFDWEAEAKADRQDPELSSLIQRAAHDANARRRLTHVFYRGAFSSVYELYAPIAAGETRMLISTNEADALFRLGRLALALAVHRGENGLFPAQLSALGSDLLPGESDPEWRHAGYSFRYRPSGTSFVLTARPEDQGISGGRGFCADSTGAPILTSDASQPLAEERISGGCGGLGYFAR